MKLVFIHGPPAAGKYTIARLVSDSTGFALFHNHLIVDAVAAVFPFGSTNFVRLREQFWRDTIRAAVAEGRSLVFTFQPEPSVSPDFPAQIRTIVEEGPGKVVFVSLTLSTEAQLRRVSNPDRAKFGKLLSAEVLRTLQPAFASCEAAMPAADLSINTEQVTAAEAARRIVALLTAN